MLYAALTTLWPRSTRTASKLASFSSPARDSFDLPNRSIWQNRKARVPCRGTAPLTTQGARFVPTPATCPDSSRVALAACSQRKPNVLLGIGYGLDRQPPCPVILAGSRTPQSQLGQPGNREAQLAFLSGTGAWPPISRFVVEQDPAQGVWTPYFCPDWWFALIADPRQISPATGGPWLKLLTCVSLDRRRRTSTHTVPNGQVL